MEIKKVFNNNKMSVKELVEHYKLFCPTLMDIYSKKTLYQQVDKLNRMVISRIEEEQRWAENKDKHNPNIAFLSSLLARIQNLKI